MLRSSVSPPLAPMFDTLRQDLRHAGRSLGRRPLFLVVPVLSLAVGIGANTAIFSAIKSLVLSDPPGVTNADRLVEVGRSTDGQGFDTFSYPNFLDLRAEVEPLAGLAGYSLSVLTASRREAGHRVFAMLVSANYFDLLGVRAARGRTFSPDEDEGVGEHPVAVLSHRYWRERLGADPEILGTTLYISRRPHIVVGIAPPGFQGHLAVASPDLYLPLMQHPIFNEGQSRFQQRGASWFQVLGLLRPGATVEEASVAVKTVFQRLAEEYPETNGRRSASVRAYGALPVPIRGPVSLFLGVLMAFVGLILIVTCANVAVMFLARASNRHREIAIRLSLGSSSGRLIRYLLTEVMLVFGLGGVAGILLARWALGLMAAWDLPAPVPIRLELTPDPVVLAFVVGLTLATGLLFGLLPARQALSVDLLGGLKGTGAEPLSADGRLRRWLVGAEIGASLVLLVAAGLFLRALQHAGQIERGFEARNAYVSLLDLSQEGYDSLGGPRFQEEMLRYFSGQPWVEEVALALDLPLDLSSHGTGVIPEGWEARSEDPYLGTEFNFVSPDYFDVLGIPILEGRGILSSDREGGEEVAVVSRNFAQRAWPGRSPLGRRVLWGTRGDTWMTVVGVVEDTQNQFLTDDPEPFLYRPLAQSYRADGYLVVRSSAGPQAVTRGVHEGLRALDPRISVSSVIDLDRYTRVGILPQRVAGALSSSLGVLALFLSGMGIYGVMAHMVVRRRREMGIRAALGAEPGALLRSVLGGALRLAVPGLILGAMGAVGVGFLLRSLLLGVSPLDPLPLAAMGMLVLGMVIIGTLVPAHRAAHIDPAEALRYD